MSYDCTSYNRITNTQMVSASNRQNVQKKRDDRGNSIQCLQGIYESGTNKWDDKLCKLK